MRPCRLALSLAALISSAFAATAEQWRGRSIYQIIVDRYALPTGSPNTPCDTRKRTWCGGSWKSITQHLDYIHEAGFTAIWISPVNQNYEGPSTVYGDPYHGYWISDVSKLNSRFGTADDLKTLSTELHKRKMYLMVDIVVNNVMSTSVTPDYSMYFFNDPSFYHKYCAVQWGNTTSEQVCWLGDENVPLPDLDMQNPTVIQRYGEWIQNLVKEYNIDGLRIDAAKHVDMGFWPGFCAEAGIFCIGEVFSGDTKPDDVAAWQGPQALDSVLNFPMYNALRSAFAIPGPVNGSNNVSVLAQTFKDSKTKFKDVSLLGNFLENQDVPRWHNISVDPQSMYNALTFTFMSDGIPIVYYGQEQYLTGGSDPNNREALWPSNYTKTAAYKHISTLNQLRNFLVSTSDWARKETQLLTVAPEGVAIMKDPVISILTNIGSPPRNNTHIAVNTPYAPSTALINVLTCRQWVVGAKGKIQAEYTSGGVANVLILTDKLNGSGLCGSQKAATTDTSISAVSVESGSGHTISSWKIPAVLIGFLYLSACIYGKFT